MATTKLKAKDFSSRLALEEHIESTLGATPDKKDATIGGTTVELSELSLSHGDSVWGVLAVASDYQEPIKTPRVERGTEFPTKLNGIFIKTK